MKFWLLLTRLLFTSAVYLCTGRSRELCAALIHLQERFPTNLYVNWLFGLAIRKSKISISELQSHLTAPNSADSDIRYWNITEHALKWALALEKYGRMQPQDGGKKIAILSIYHNMTSAYLATAMVLVRLGHEVHLVLLPRSRDALPDSGWETALIRNELEALKSNLTLEGLTIHLLSDYTRVRVPQEVKDVIKAQSIDDVKQTMQAPDLDLRDGRARRLLRFRNRQGLEFAGRFRSFIDRHDFDHWLVDSGSWAEYTPAYHMLEERGIMRVCPAFKTERGYIVIAVNRTFTEMDTSQAWKEEMQQPFEADRQSRIVQQMRKREDPRYYAAHSNFAFQRAQKLKRDDLLTALHLDDRRPIVLMLPNVAWDTTLLAPRVHRSFQSMKEWLIETVRFFSRRPELQLVVRPHPSEFIFNSADRADATIQAVWPVLPANVTLLDRDTEINTYALIECARLVLTYTSDVGWEAVVRGVPAICAGNGHYTRYGFVQNPETREAYERLLEQFSEVPESLALTNRQRELGLRYADLYSNIIPKPFPWCHFGVWRSLTEIPVEYVLSNAGLTEFSEAFHLLANPPSSSVGFIGRGYNYPPE